MNSGVSLCVCVACGGRRMAYAPSLVCDITIQNAQAQEALEKQCYILPYKHIQHPHTHTHNSGNSSLESVILSLIYIPSYNI